MAEKEASSSDKQVLFLPPEQALWLESVAGIRMLMSLCSPSVSSIQYAWILYRMIVSVLDPRKCEYLKNCSLDFEHAYMTTYLAS